MRHAATSRIAVFAPVLLDLLPRQGLGPPQSTAVARSVPPAALRADESQALPRQLRNADAGRPPRQRALVRGVLPAAVPRARRGRGVRADGGVLASGRASTRCVGIAAAPALRSVPGCSPWRRAQLGPVVSHHCPGRPSRYPQCLTHLRCRDLPALCVVFVGQASKRGVPTVADPPR